MEGISDNLVIVDGILMECYPIQPAVPVSVFEVTRCFLKLTALVGGDVSKVLAHLPIREWRDTSCANFVTSNIDVYIVMFMVKMSANLVIIYKSNFKTSLAIKITLI